MAVQKAVRDAGTRYESYRTPGVMNSDPEVASVGLTMEEAQARGHRVKVGRQAMEAISRVHALGENAGFIKFVLDADTDKHLGMHMLAHMAGELLPQVVLAMHAGSIDPLRASECAHPTPG